MIKLEALAGHHDRSGFDCGTPELNAWLKQTALQHQVKGVSRTFVATPLDQTAVQSYAESGYLGLHADSILGYYALASAFVLLEQLPKDLAKKYPRQIPVTRLGRLATRSDLQGQGLGALLLADAVSRARNAALAVGSAGIFVDAKTEDAARFYERYGFRPCADQTLKLYLPMW
jgi:GNAT superfamily N-acetyltransferase